MTLFHYTDAAALTSLIEFGKFWLSDIRFLNDHSEYKDGESAIKNVFHALAKKIDPAEGDLVLTNFGNHLDHSKLSFTFIASFSRGQDLLSQWRGYCPRSGGYALEFEVPDIKKFGIPMHECVYLDEGKTDASKSLFELSRMVLTDPKKAAKKINRVRLFQTTWANIAKFKNKGFHEENEVRAIVFRNADDSSVKFRTRDNLIIPYIEHDIPFSMLTRIWIGPCQNPDLAKEGLERFLSMIRAKTTHPLNSLPAPEVRLSGITFRG